MSALSTAEELKATANSAFSAKEFTKAQADYSKALCLAGDTELDLKATLFQNRAAAFLALNNYGAALQDSDAALALDPSREKAIYRRAQALEGLGKTGDALKDLKDLLHRDPGNRAAVSAARRCREKIESEAAVERSPIAGAIAKVREGDAEEKTNALKAIIALGHDDEGAARVAVRLGGLEILWALRDVADEVDTSTLAVKALASLCSYRANVDVANAAGLGGAEFADLVSLIEAHPPSRARAAASLALLLLTKGSRPSASAVSEEDHTGALAVWAAAVSHSDGDVRSSGLEAVVQWCSEAAPSWAEGSGSSMAERRAQQDGERQWKKALSLRAIAVCKSPINLSMFHLLDSSIVAERALSLAAYGRVMIAVDDDDEAKSLLATLAATTTRDLSHMRRKAALTSALFLAKGDLGAWFLSMDGAVNECLALIASGDEIGQTVAAETLCLAASNDSGRSLLAPVVEAGTLDALLDSPNARARSAAASTMAKLGVASKALTSDSSDTGRLLNTAMMLLKGAEDAATTDQTTQTLSQAKFAESVSVTTERAVEVLAALITKSAVKDELAHGSGRCAMGLNRLCRMAKDGKGAAAYGLAHIFASLSVTNKEVQERLLAEREMEITPEQLAELQRITKQKSEAEEDTDDAERCGWRIRQIVQCDGIRALVRLSQGASAKTEEQIALALRQIAVEPSVRGSLIQQGGYRTCLDLAAKDSAKCVRDASWCLGKTLVTTNPGVLTAPQRVGCVSVLLRLLKDHRCPDLAHFEVLLGLTNVASFSDEIKARIVGEKGLRTLEYMQFSDHLLVRRAATECLTNLMPHPDMVAHLRDGEKLKLWCAFAEDFESDLPTARAAAGCLAMACGLSDSELQASLQASRACQVFVDLLKCGAAELVHRAAVGIGYMTDSPECVEKFKELNARASLAGVAKKKSPEWASAASAAKDASRALVAASVSAAVAANSPTIVEADTDGTFDVT